MNSSSTREGVDDEEREKLENLSEKYVNFDVKSAELFIRPNGMFACITAEERNEDIPYGY